MNDIETLTDEERASLTSVAVDGFAEADEAAAVAKALRIIDAYRLWRPSVAAGTKRGADPDGFYFNGWFVSLDAIRATLAAQGLHVVTTAGRDELATLRARVARAEAELLADNSPRVCVALALQAIRGQ